jgi:DNA-directed RNA polymerase specialized sigma24 family protein
MAPQASGERPHRGQVNEVILLPADGTAPVVQSDRQQGVMRAHAKREGAAEDPSPEPSWAALLQLLRRWLKRVGAHADSRDDLAQDAMLCMLVAMSRGTRVEDWVAFGKTIVHRRWIDEVRRQKQAGEHRPSNRPSSAILAAEPTDTFGTSDWAAQLRAAGWRPTEAWGRILEAISSGARGTNKIAEVLGRDVKTVHESRKRLQRWLQEKLDDPPNPQNDSTATDLAG